MMVVLVGQGRAMESHNDSFAIDLEIWLEYGQESKKTSPRK